jgi:hypothetical protein
MLQRRSVFICSWDFGRRKSNHENPDSTLAEVIYEDALVPKTNGLRISRRKIDTKWQEHATLTPERRTEPQRLLCRPSNVGPALDRLFLALCAPNYRF